MIKYFITLIYNMKGCNCNTDISKTINIYMNFGWIKLSNIFEKNKYGKEKYLKDCVNENLLRLLGSIRHYTIDNLFNCINKNNDNKYIAYGSTNVTSDYDLTIVGSDAPNIIWKMFNLFLKKYKNTSTHIFDTNLYCIGTYINNKSNNFNEKLIVDKEYFILEPKTKNDKILVLNYAFIKLLNLKINNNKINHYLNNAKKIKYNLDEIYENELIKINKKYNNYDKDSLELITKYKLYSDYAKKLFKILYGKSKQKNIIELATLSNNYAIEAYYTPCTFNVVVMELQGKFKLKLSKINYICSVIENLGDLNNHINHEKKNNVKKLLLKYSKYIYRIYYSLGKALNNKTILNKATKINENVIPQRSTGDVTKVNYKLLDYDNEKLDKYLNKFNGNILKNIENLI